MIYIYNIDRSIDTDIDTLGFKTLPVHICRVETKTPGLAVMMLETLGSSQDFPQCFCFVPWRVS